MSETIYLYLKTHNNTGLKYLGKTVQNPFEYRGSGLVWNRHLDKHGDNVTTEILFQTEDMEEFKQVGLEYSEKWNIVESKEFANLVPESGSGGDTSMCFTEETRKRLSESSSRKRKPHSEESKRNISEAKKKELKKECPHCGKFADAGNYAQWHGDNCGKGKIHNHLFTKKSTCPHCGKEGQNAIMQRWHFDNCKEKRKCL